MKFAVLICLLGLVGCGLNPKSLTPTWDHIRERHDAYVKTDESLTDLEREVYLNSTRIFDELLRE